MAPPPTHLCPRAPAAPHLCPCCTRRAYRTRHAAVPGARRLHHAALPYWQRTAGLDYGAGTLLPSHRSLTLLAAGYTDKAAYAGWYEGVGVADGAVDTGNNAWVGVAFANPSPTPNP